MTNNFLTNAESHRPEMQSQHLLSILYRNGIMPTVNLNDPNLFRENSMIQQQISSLDLHCRDSFAEQKAKLHHLAATSEKHEAKIDQLLQDTAVLKAHASEHLAKKSDLLELEMRLSEKFDGKITNQSTELSQKIDSQSAALNQKIDDHFKWLIGGGLAMAGVICGTMYAVLLKTEGDLKASIENNKTELAEVRKEMKSNHESVSQQLAEIRTILQEKQSTASNQN